MEYILLYGREYKGNGTKKEIISLEGNNVYTKFKRKAYLENTKLLDYGIEYLADCFTNGTDCDGENIRRALNDNYYFDNFIQYLAFHQLVKVDEKGQVIEFTSDSAVMEICGLVKFQMLYQEIFRQRRKSAYETEIRQEELENIENKFAQMVEYLKCASNALDGEIIIPYQTKQDKVEKYIALGLAKEGVIGHFEGNDQDLIKFMRANAVFEAETYRICEFEHVKEARGILIKFYGRLSTGNDNISTVYMLFSFHKQSESGQGILHALKHILCFRNKIWEILNLSSSTLLQNWADDLFYKQQMLKSRAAGHTEWDNLVESLSQIAKKIVKNRKQEADVMLKGYFELTVNSMIGMMNSQVLGGKGTDFVRRAPVSFESFWNSRENNIFQAASILWGLEICIEDKMVTGGKNIREVAEPSNKVPNLDTLAAIFLAVLQNAYKHGCSNKENKIRIKIYEKAEMLCISNQIRDDKQNELREIIMPEAHRSGTGISQALVFDICCSWYPDTQHKDFFSIERNGNKSFYVVKLPILERRM